MMTPTELQRLVDRWSALTPVVVKGGSAGYAAVDERAAIKARVVDELLSRSAPVPLPDGSVLHLSRDLKDYVRCDKHKTPLCCRTWSRRARGQVANLLHDYAA